MISVNSINKTNYMSFKHSSIAQNDSSDKKQMVPEYEQIRIQNDINTVDALKTGFGITSMFLASIAVVLAFKNNVSKSNNIHHDLSKVIANFKSLKDVDEIPILNDCKSLDKKLKSFLEKQLELNNNINQKESNTKQANRMILYGPPGVGKSYFAKIFAKTIGADYAEVTFSDINSVWSGENVAKMQSIFESIIKEAGSNKDKKFVIVFNEMEAFISSIEKLHNNAGYTNHVLEKIEERNTFINYIDKLSKECPNVIVIGTTNVGPKEGIDGAVISRFKQNLVRLDFPSEDCLKEAFLTKAAKINLQDAITKIENENLILFINRVHERHCSFRDLEVVIEKAHEDYIIDNKNLKNTKTFIQYLNESLDSIDSTDGEIHRRKGV